MAVTKSGNTFVWGSNIRGQLGYDPKVCKYLALPTKICLSLKESVDEELKVEVSEESQDVLMEEDKVQTEHEIYEEQKKSANLFDTVTHAVCGTWSSIFVTETNKTRLHVWGGEEDIVNSSVILYHNKDDSNSIEYIKSRGDIVIYINKSGELYEYSIKNKKSKFIEKLPFFRDLSLGSNYMGIVHQDNTLHMKGLNKEGQLGTGDKINRMENFELITTMEPTRIDKINCGISNTVALSKFIKINSLPNAFSKRGTLILKNGFKNGISNHLQTSSKQKRPKYRSNFRWKA
jgi:alpha-tubulin suppressor-like RCC1 family protein